VDSVPPEVTLSPDHAPEAVQEVAFVEDQLSIEAPPLVTDVGLAATETVAVELPEAPVDAESSVPPPQAGNARPRTRAAMGVLARRMGILIPSLLDRYGPASGSCDSHCVRSWGFRG